ncbi:hypothetical protein NFI96_008553, partial [Prochilodus magdalenae]
MTLETVTPRDSHTRDSHTKDSPLPETDIPKIITLETVTPRTVTPETVTHQGQVTPEVHSHTKDSHTRDSHTKDNDTGDSHTRDSHTKDSHTRDSHTKDNDTGDSHTRDSHITQDNDTGDSHIRDSHTKIMTMETVTPETVIPKIMTLETQSHQGTVTTRDSHTKDSHTRDSHTKDNHTGGQSHQTGTTKILNTTAEGTAVTMTRFEPTPKMSSYLLALVISDFTNVQSTEKTLVRIWARSQAVADGHCAYALNLTGPILEFFEDYYKVPYPLSKSDQVALPDFYFGAMENWGLVTYRETNLFYDPVMSSNANKEQTASIVAHELAHMWFGNLVTLKWWNEKDLIVLDDIHRVFAVDALASSRPLSSKEEDITRPEQISEVFDTISYSKGASVLRMLSDFLTEPVFLQGLKVRDLSFMNTTNVPVTVLVLHLKQLRQTYLNTFAYKNTVGSDLWDHLQTAVIANGTGSLPATVGAIMDRWVLQMGFPVVTVNTSTGQLSQKHFLLDPESVVEAPSQFDYEWIIPINWMKSGVEQTPVWLLEKSAFHSGMKTVGGDWVLLNLNLTGYYRVNYDTENWERILNQLNSDHQAVPLINRAQIVDDAFNLARAGMVAVSLALNTTRFLRKETAYLPWQSALNNLDYLYLMLDQTSVYESMQ